jgi:glycine oxidase
MAKNPDVVIVGGGVVGAALAWRLAKDGRSVVLLERGEIGREASWAAGGILTPVHLADYPPALSALCDASAKLYPDLVRELRDDSGVDVEYRVCGFLIVERNDEEAGHTAQLEAFKRGAGLPVERLGLDALRELQPGLSSDVRGGLLLPDIAQIRNPRLAVAFAEAARKKGVDVRPNVQVTGFLRVPGRVNGVRTTQGDVYAGTTVIASGAWSGDVLKPLGLALAVKPIKGQILLTQAAPGTIGPVIEAADTYLIPRADGKILIGSTLEDVGFDKRVTLDAVSSLAARAAAILPALGNLPLVTSWAGLRPSTPDRLPYIGRTSMEGLLVSTGHYRNGILLSPISAALIADLIAGRTPSMDLAPFDPGRGSA